MLIRMVSLVYAFLLQRVEAEGDDAEKVPLLIRKSCKFEFNDTTETMIIDLQVVADALGYRRNKIKRLKIK